MITEQRHLIAAGNSEIDTISEMNKPDRRLILTMQPKRKTLSHSKF
jgi:hypothetical protein